MAKASLRLPNGTTVAIEGTAEEVRKLLEFYGGGKNIVKLKKKGQKLNDKERQEVSGTDIEITEIVNLVKNCDQAQVIEEQILDRTGQVNRAILPLYIVHEYMENKFGLTTGEVNKITKELGIPISPANISHTYSGSAKRYVLADRVRKRGQPVRYKLSRRGVTYLKGVLKDTEGGK